MPIVERTIEINASIDRVFAFVTDIRNHPRLVPPETCEQVLDAGEIPLKVGTVVRFRARYAGVYWTMASRITAFDEPVVSRPQFGYFRDEQVRGPFASWRHDHWFESGTAGITRLTDRFTVAAPICRRKLDQA